LVAATGRKGMQFGTLADWFGAVGEWCSGLAGCLGALATFLAVVVALFASLLTESLRHLVQRRGAEIVGISQIEQESPDERRRLKTRLRIRNRTFLGDMYRVYVTEIAGRSDFIEVPLVWMHGYAEGEQPATITEIGSKEHGWIDFLTVQEKVSAQGVKTTRLLLDVGVGVGVKQLQVLPRGTTQLMLKIDPHYGRSKSYSATVDWDGTYSRPGVSYEMT